MKYIHLIKIFYNIFLCRIFNEICGKIISALVLQHQIYICIITEQTTVICRIFLLLLRKKDCDGDVI